MKNIAQSTDLFKEIKSLIIESKNSVVRQINSTMVFTYYQIGRVIVENEQGGEELAEYGKSTLKDLSKRLTKEFGRGFSVDNLENMRRFFITYKNSETLSRKFNLSWSHYVFLIRLDEAERGFYEIEAGDNNWSVRELERQYNSGLYARLALSRDKDGVVKLSQKGQLVEKPEDIIKEPYILEFLGLDEKQSYTETTIEQAIIDKIGDFLLEMGKGFSFVGRQKRFTFDEEHFYVDLVFNNRLLKCFVLVDLKMGKLKHQDLGQMQMYVNYYDRYEKTTEENPTIGIILCQDKKDTLVEITLPKDHNIFAKQYKLYLPSQNELKKQVQMALAENVVVQL